MKRFKDIVKIVFSITILLVLVLYCSSPTEPWVKDPRDYTWTVDTIHNPDPASIQTMLSSIWGSSPNNVYACGHTDGGPNIYHYNGEKWEAIDLRDYGLSKGYRNKVFGFSWNDVWIAGGLGHGYVGNRYINSNLIHFNGNTWESYEFEARSELTDVWGTSSDNLWACGRYGLVINYDGHVWEFDTVSTEHVNWDSKLYLYSIREFNDEVYVVGYRDSNPYYFFKKSNGNWTVIDSVEVGRDEFDYGTTGLFISNENQFFSYGYKGLFNYPGNAWEKLLPVSSSVTGMSEIARNRFLVSEFKNNLYLMENGSFEVIKQTGADDIYFVEVWATNEECFVLSWDYNSNWGGTLVYHGK